jgi:hypothetical protein
MSKPHTSIETERQSFRRLIAINPNYFGNFPQGKYKVVKKIANNTTYEDITCVGYNAIFSTLEATIAVKQPVGYKGTLCKDGSTEYVRFFIDYGSGWQDAGISMVNVHDIPNSKDCDQQKDKPLTYVVSLKIDPKKNYCKYPVIPKVHAILSWEIMPPAGPSNVGWLPVWGDSLECYVQIQPRKKYLHDYLSEIEVLASPKVEIPPELKLVSCGPIPDPPPLSLAELSDKYRKNDPHRFGLSDLQSILSSDFVDQKMMAAMLEEWNSLGLDISKSVATLEQTKANVDYEELECLGLDYHEEKLVATFRIKRETGYSGDLCKPGSFEYIAFWADWENICKWTFLAIRKINVHDLEDVTKKGGICYSVVLPVDLSQHRQGCEKPKIAKVRAVLSWNVPPSNTDPEDLQHWGNRLDAHVQIRPGEFDPGAPPKLVLGGIHVAEIDPGTGMTLPDAKFSLGGAFADSTKLSGPRRPCPFGGGVLMQVPEIGPGIVNKWYKVELLNITTGFGPIILNTPLLVQRSDGFWHPVPKIGDYYQFQEFDENWVRTIQNWDSAGDDLWDVHITFRDGPSDAASLIAIIGHKIQLDNTAPNGPPSVPLTMDIHIDPIAGSPGDCRDVNEGESITGKFIADDLHFGVWSLSTAPNTFTTPSNQPTVSGLARNDPAPVPGGHAWSLATGPSPTDPGAIMMHPCGYVVRLDVYDRSIRNSVPGSHNHNHIEVGFCLRKKVT